MKTILEWLNEAKEQGYDWAEAAIRNYDPEFTTIKETGNLKEALWNAFSWWISPEGSEFWMSLSERLRSDEEMDGFPSTIAPVTPTHLEDLIEDLGKLNSALENLEHNETLKEPYRTQVYEATKDSYEKQLAEVKAKIAESLGIEPIKERKLIGWVVQNEDDTYSMWILPTFTKEDGGWSVVGTKNWVDITPEQAAALCDRLPQWSDDEPTPVYP